MCSPKDFFIHVLNRNYKDIRSLPELPSSKVPLKHPVCTMLLLLHLICGTFLTFNTAGKVFKPLKVDVTVWCVQ